MAYDFERKYAPADAVMSPRFTGIRSFMRVPYVTDVNEYENIDVGIVGIPFDTGASFRAGARFGPEAVRRISSFLRPANPYHRLDPFDYCAVADLGDLFIIPGYTEDSYKSIEDGLYKILDKGVIPIGIGGDHAITLGELRAAYRKHGKLALVHFDSHSDTNEAYWGKKYTHGTPFKRAYEEGLIDTSKSVQLGMRGNIYGDSDYDNARQMGFTLLTTEDMMKMKREDIARTVKEIVGDSPVFLTFDIDFFDPAYAPGTGTPEVGGFTSFEGLDLLRKLTGLNYVAFDMVEVYPGFDPAEITALLGATVIFEMISHIALGKKEKAGRA